MPTDRYGSARAAPSFVAYLLIAEAVGSSRQSRVALLPSVASNPQFAAYAVWDPAVRQSGPARLVLLNLSTRNVATSQAGSDAVAVTVDLNAYVKPGKVAQVKRMTSIGLDSTDSSAATWAGQSFENGIPSGTEVVEPLEGGKVIVQGSEGVLVIF